MTKLAAQFKISDVALTKICRRHEIPVPGRGFWARVAAGYPLKRPELRLPSRPELEEMRNSFAMGARNKRGATSRAYDEGGGQERELAATYRAHARLLHDTHVYVAAMLEQLASSYENDGLQQDLQAKLRSEGY